MQNSDGDEFDSETGELIRYDREGNDSELMDEGWIVPDDQFSDSDEGKSSVTLQEGENEAEYELRRQ